MIRYHQTRDNGWKKNFPINKVFLFSFSAAKREKIKASNKSSQIDKLQGIRLKP